MFKTGTNIRRNPVRAALGKCRAHFAAAALFSAVSNILLLTPSIYMMQIYDRVIPTGGLVTLAAISAIGLFALATMSVFDWLRGRLLVRAGARLDEELAGTTLRLIMSNPALGQLQRAEAMRYLDRLRQGVSSPAAIALFDAPWAPIYVLAAFLLHPALGALALAASVLMVLLTYYNERRTEKPGRIANEAANLAYSRQSQMSTYAAEVRALGMASALTTRQLAERAEVNGLQVKASFIGADHNAIVKLVRLTLQSGALALGAVLVVEGSVSGGAVFASSLLISRALQPVEQLIASWRSLLQTRIAYDKLGELFEGEQDRSYIHLPAPTGAVAVENLVVANSGTGRIALADANFSVSAGQIVGVVGLSGAGKSTLLRAIAGAANIARGTVRIDGASVTDWDPEQLSSHIGYLPQNFILFPGSIRDNICRFQAGEAGNRSWLDQQVVSAAQMIDAHEMILRLPEGYDTVIGTGGTGLSAGQTQRIAIARALFGQPQLLLLDEPTAHLDGQAQHAFMKALIELRRRGATVLFATHNTDVLAGADMALVVKDGRVDRLAPLTDIKSQARPVSHNAQKASS